MVEAPKREPWCSAPPVASAASDDIAMEHEALMALMQPSAEERAELTLLLGNLPTGIGPAIEESIRHAYYDGIAAIAAILRDPPVAMVSGAIRATCNATYTGCLWPGCQNDLSCRDKNEAHRAALTAIADMIEKPDEG